MNERMSERLRGPVIEVCERVRESVCERVRGSVCERAREGARE